jgi:hypothetical protein
VEVMVLFFPALSRREEKAIMLLQVKLGSSRAAVLRGPGIYVPIAPVQCALHPPIRGVSRAN